MIETITPAGTDRQVVKKKVPMRQAKIMDQDSQNVAHMTPGSVLKNPDTAMHSARRTSGTGAIIFRDGAAGGIDVNASRTKSLRAGVPTVGKGTDAALLSMLLRRHGIDPATAHG